MVRVKAQTPLAAMLVPVPTAKARRWSSAPKVNAKFSMAEKTPARMQMVRPTTNLD